MAAHVLAKEILSKIINEKTPFSLALKQAFKNENLSKEDKTIISALVGCVLRHYLVLKKIIKAAYVDVNSDAFCALLVAFCNALFIKKIEQKECEAYTESFLNKEDLKVKDFIEPYLNDKKLVPEDIEIGSYEFLTYRYNTPTEIIKMWSKQFGHVTTHRILKSNSKPAPTVVRINNNLINDDDFFNQNPDFERGETNGVAIYNGATKIKNHPLYEQKVISILPLAYKEALDEGDLDLFKGLAIYSEYPNDIIYELLARFSRLNNVEFIAGSYSAFNNCKNLLNREGIKGVNVYEANASSIITCLSKPVHTFLLMPDSSRLNLLQILPDYFLHFSMEKLDELIANQAHVLEEAASQIEDGGYLIYLVDTISRKENSTVINNFLKQHPDFTLTRDKIYFPYKKYGGSYYFAVLKKENKND